MENKIEWADLIGYEGIYKISKTGLIMSKRRTGAVGGILQGIFNPLGYKIHLLSKNGKKQTVFIHRMVALTFLPNPKNLPYINHKDENPSNNNLENLEWCDAKYNTNYGGGIARRSESRYKPIGQYDLDGNLIKLWKSGSHVTKELNFLHAKISEVARGKRKTAYGFLWKFHSKNSITYKNTSGADQAGEKSKTNCNSCSSGT